MIIEKSFSIKERTYCCPVELTLDVVGGKYKFYIIWVLSHETKRFSELQKSIPQATNKMLIQQLRELESDGLINREVYAVVPPKVEYSLTELGISLLPVMSKMAEWGNQFGERKS